MNSDLRLLGQILKNRVRDGKGKNKVIDILLSETPAEKIPLSNIENNAAAIQIGASPRANLVEPATNGLDATVESNIQAKDKKSSPAKAAESIGFGPSFMLKNASKMGKVLPKLRLPAIPECTILESGDKKRPSLLFRDFGVGMTAEEASNLTRLYNGAKTDKKFSAGEHGVGSRQCLAYCDGAVVLTKSSKSKSSKIAVTVLFSERSNPDSPLSYKYIGFEDGSIPSFTSEELDLDFEPGTEITYVSYDCTGFERFSSAGSNNIFHSLETSLPFLNIPIRINSERKNEPKQNRYIVGIYNRLFSIYGQKNSKVEWISEQTLTFAKSSLPVRILVNKSDVKVTETRTSDRVFITLNGQVHGTLPESYIRKSLKKPFIAPHTLIYIAIDELPREIRESIVTSSRDTLKDSVTTGDLLDLVASTLCEDSDLVELDNKFQEEKMGGGDDEVDEALSKELTDMISNLTKSSASILTNIQTNTKRKKRQKGNKTTLGINPDDSKLPLIPTSFEFKESSISVIRGDDRWITVKLNAKNGYLPSNEKNLTISIRKIKQLDISKAPAVTVKKGLIGGTAKWKISTGMDTEIGNYTVSASLKVGSKTLETTLKLEVKNGKIGPHRKNRKNRKVTPVPQKKVQLIFVNAEKMAEISTSDDIGMVTESVDNTIIYINEEYERFQQFTGLVPGRVLLMSDTVKKRRRNDYAKAVGFTIFRLHYESRESNISTEKDDLIVTRKIFAEGIIKALDASL